MLMQKVLLLSADALLQSTLIILNEFRHFANALTLVGDVCFYGCFRIEDLQQGRFDFSFFVKKKQLPTSTFYCQFSQHFGDAAQFTTLIYTKHLSLTTCGFTLPLRAPSNICIQNKLQRSYSTSTNFTLEASYKPAGVFILYLNKALLKKETHSENPYKT